MYIKVAERESETEVRGIERKRERENMLVQIETTTKDAYRVYCHVMLVDIMLSICYSSTTRPTSTCSPRSWPPSLPPNQSPQTVVSDPINIEILCS